MDSETSPTRAPSILDVLDVLGFGALILHRLDRVVATNTRAERYLGSHVKLHAPLAPSQPMRLTDGLVSYEDECNWNGILVSADASSDDHSARRPLLFRRIELEDEPGATLLVVVDIADCLDPSDHLLHELFHLTPAESRLAKLLANGRGLSEIASENGANLGTLRVQLKSIFGKTATARQGELVALLGRISRLPSEAQTPRQEAPKAAKPRSRLT